MIPEILGTIAALLAAVTRILNVGSLARKAFRDLSRRLRLWRIRRGGKGPTIVQIRSSRLKQVEAPIPTIIVKRPLVASTNPSHQDPGVPLQ